MAARVTATLRDVGVEVDEPDEAGNVLARMRGRDPDRSVLLCAHLDTVPHPGVVEPDLRGRRLGQRGETILGADNKAAVAGLLALARRAAIEGVPVGVELLFTTREEVGLQGAKAFDVTRLRSDVGYVYDHATPIGEIVTAAPTYYRLERISGARPPTPGCTPRTAAARSRRRHARSPPCGWGASTRRRPPTSGRSRAAIRVRRTSSPSTRRSWPRRAASNEDKVEQLVAEMVDHVHDAANTPACECDVDVMVERLFTGYRHRPQAPAVLAAEDALRDCGYEPRRIATGGGADANVFMDQASRA